MCITIKGIEVDLDKIIDFRMKSMKKQADGRDRRLWFDREESRFFETCETKNTNYNIDDCVCVDFVEGDNNSQGLLFLCESCTGCIDEFMMDKNINMDYPQLYKFMNDLYYAKDKSNKYGISEEEIIKYHENYTCSWYCNYFEDCAYDYFRDEILEERI